MKKIFMHALIALLVASLIFGAVGCSKEDSIDKEAELAEAPSTYSDDVDTVAEKPESVPSATGAAEEPSEGSVAREESKSDSFAESESMEEPAAELADSGASKDEADYVEECVEPDERKNTISPQAGQLTAGEWSDNEDFDFFLDLLNENEWYDKMDMWGFDDFSRIEVNVYSYNKPVQNAVVKLMDEQEDVVFTAKTDNKGIAYVFPYLFDKETDKEFTVEVSYGRETTTKELSDIDDTQSIDISLQIPVKKSNEIDIMFMIDTTGSMSDELSYIQSELTYVIEEVQKANANDLDIRVSANFYRDQQDEYVCKTYDFDRNISRVVSQISKQSANGGGDYPEAVEVALEEGISEHNWNDDARARIMFLILDAPPHLNNKVLRVIKEQTIEAAKQGIKIIPVASSGVDKDTEFLLRFLDVSTNGTYVFLTDDSGIGNSHIEPTIGYYQVEYLNKLLIRLINEEVE